MHRPVIQLCITTPTDGEINGASMRIAGTPSAQAVLHCRTRKLVRLSMALDRSMRE
jgi:hypothetical protein